MKSEQIALELEAMRGADGMIHAEEVWRWARAHPDSALHSQYEWDMQRAAEEHWTATSRRLIAVYIVANDGERRFVSLTIDRKERGGYRDVQDVLKDDELRKVLVRDALTEFKRVRAKYEHIKELASVYVEIDKVDRQYPESKALAA